MRKQIEISGKIVKGRGRSKEDILPFNDKLKSVLDQDVYPGTLNLVLDGPLLLNSSQCTTFDNGKRFLWEVSALGCPYPIYIYRWRGCPLHIIELISSHKLRKVLNLKESDVFKLYINSRIVEKAPLIKQLAWYLLWYKRNSAYYGSESYKQFVYKLKRIRKLASQN